MTADLARLRGLMEKATPGEWKAFDNGSFWDINTPWPEDTEAERYSPSVAACWETLDQSQQEGNAQFIAAMKNALPALLAEVEQLRTAVSDAETIINRGVELMTTDQVGNWTGVRHWLETQTIDAAQEAECPE